MAKLGLYAVFDTKAGMFLPPFSCNARGEGIRMFIDWMRDSSLPFSKHVADYQLFYIGTYDNVVGSLDGVPVADRVIGGDEIGDV